MRSSFVWEKQNGENRLLCQDGFGLTLTVAGSAMTEITVQTVALLKNIVKNILPQNKKDDTLRQAKEGQAG